LERHRTTPGIALKLNVFSTATPIRIDLITARVEFFLLQIISVARVTMMMTRLLLEPVSRQMKAVSCSR
jgi:hypothetical protein